MSCSTCTVYICTPLPEQPVMQQWRHFLGRRRRPYIVFRNRFLYGFMFVYIYVRVASRNRTLGTLKRNGVFAISVYLHAFCTILRSLVALGTSVTKKL